jgi:hypothetical protein
MRGSQGVGNNISCEPTTFEMDVKNITFTDYGQVFHSPVHLQYCSAQISD